jgi:hypothetical protein
MKAIKSTLGVIGLVVILTSCGGKPLCDAYSYLDYKKEAEEYKVMKQRQSDQSKVQRIEIIEEV